MKAALAQTNIIWENKAENMKTASKMIAEAARENCDFIVFPEVSLTGFTMNIDILAEDENNSPTLEFFKEEAEKNKIYITFGMALRKADGKVYNEAVTLNDNGEIISNYSKIHPFSHGVEAKFFSGGNKIEWFDLKGITVSPFVCYDVRFPEVFQIASVKSRLIFVIACWPDVRTFQWDAIVRARAIENQAFVVAVNRTGDEMKYTYGGHSQIISPRGEILTELQSEEALITAEFDITEADIYRREFNLKADRRPDFYKQFW